MANRNTLAGQSAPVALGKSDPKSTQLAEILTRLYQLNTSLSGSLDFFAQAIFRATGESSGGESDAKAKDKPESVLSQIRDQLDFAENYAEDLNQKVARLGNIV